MFSINAIYISNQFSISCIQLISKTSMQLRLITNEIMSFQLSPSFLLSGSGAPGGPRGPPICSLS